MLSKLKIFMILVTIPLLFNGCIENDIPYANVPLVISEFEVEGQTSAAEIDKVAQTVKVILEETVNPAEVQLNKISYIAEYEGDSAYYEPGEIRSSLNTDIIDLRDTLNIILSLYQDYVWTIHPEQPINRKFVIEGQVGNAVFDVSNKVATAYIRKNGSLDNICLKDLKLGPVGASYNGVTDTMPEILWNQYSNYCEAFVNVTYSDFINEDWTLRVTRKNSDVLTLDANPMVNAAWLYGTGLVGVDFRFEYRELDVAEWITVPQKDLIIDGGDYSARINGLKANTTYVYRACSGIEYGEEVTFTTYSPEEIPNMGFEDWSKSGKVICPWAEGDESFWDCGNWGSNTVSENNITVPDTDLPKGSKGKFSAKLETKSIVGIMAAGNMFVGAYKGTKGMNGVLGLGRPYSSFPTKLTGYYKYKSEIIKSKSKGYEHLWGTQDSCSIYIALGDWEPDGEGTFVKVETDNGKNKGIYFDVDDPHIIAYGSMGTDKSSSEYQKFTIELDYRALNRRPTGIIIVCAASKYGDFFVGGVGSTLWIDDFNLEYDY